MRWRIQAEQRAEYLPAKDAEHVFCPTDGGRILRHRRNENNVLLLNDLFLKPVISSTINRDNL
jgi:hypothetical protein